MKISRIVLLIAILLMLNIASISCSTVEVKTPEAGADAKLQTRMGDSSEIQGDYLLTKWQESAEEGFTLNFEAGKNAKILEIVKNALGLPRYDIIAFIANENEIKAFVPALGIYEYKKNQDSADMTSMSDILKKSWHEVASIQISSKIRLMSVYRITSTKAINLFIADEDGVLHKSLISDASKFLEVTDYGVRKLEVDKSVKLTTLADDKINSILPIFSKESVFALLFSGSLIQVNINKLEIVQVYPEILWNGYVLTTRVGETGTDLIIAGRHPETPIVVYTWNEVGDFKELHRIPLHESTTVKHIFGSEIFIINTDDVKIVTNRAFTKMHNFFQFSRANLSSVDITEDFERIFISTDKNAYIVGAKIQNDEYALSTKNIDLSEIIAGIDMKSITSPVLGRFIDKTYLMLIIGNQVKLVRTKYDNQIEGAYEIMEAEGDAVEELSTPDYRDIKKYEELLDSIELHGDWEAMKDVYKSINKDFKPSGSYFPGYAGTAMRGGWIEDTLADSMKDRELIAALIMMYWNEGKHELLLGENVNLLRNEYLPLPRYIKIKQPLATLHRALILSKKKPQWIIDSYIEYLNLWSESFKNGYKDFKNLGIKKDEIKEMKELWLNLGLEIFDYIPAPIRDYHTKLLAALESSEFLADLDDIALMIEERKQTFKSKWILGD